MTEMKVVHHDHAATYLNLLPILKTFLIIHSATDISNVVAISKVTSQLDYNQ